MSARRVVAMAAIIGDAYRGGNRKTRTPRKSQVPPAARVR
jgi:hypothetical protein